MKKSFGQSGMTLVEMTVTMALVVVLGGIVYSLVQYADRQTKIQTEDIQNMIIKYGGSRILQSDVSRATPSFNFMQVPDKDNKPFFVLALNDYCQHADCERTIKMEIPAGQNVSEPFFLLTINGTADEMIRFTVEPQSTFEAGVYQGVNPAYADPDLTIDKTNLKHSPWTKGRLILLSTANQFFDCNSLTNSMTLGGATCKISCKADTSCNYATTRYIKFLGVVENPSKDMGPVSVVSRPLLFNPNYQICQPDALSNCSVPAPRSFTASTSKDLFEKMPFIPGSDNLTTITPVQLVRYHLEKPTPNSPDHTIFLMRSVATIAGTSPLSFTNGHILMTGIQSIVFTRKNISNPTIEYKLNKVRTQISIK